MSSPGWYPDPSDPVALRYWDGTAWSHRTARVDDARERLRAEAELRELETQAEALRRQIVHTSDAMLLQEVGIYEYSHPLDDAAAYKPLLDDLDRKLTAAVKAGTAVTSTKKWVINGSEKEGAKMVSDFSKLILRAYNNEADNVVRTLRPYSVDAATTRLDKLRASVAKLGASMKLGITDEYHDLRVREIRLTADYLQKVADQKEQEREERARLREEAIARREFAAEQARLEKERQHYLAAAAALSARGDASAAAEAQAKAAEAQEAIDGVLQRAANIRAGYVYVISNFGAFGERMVKIGLTRRLHPLDRVHELGGASVPFRFDLHALIFSQDAVSLETALHREFAKQRVNLVNGRREFFYVSPADVKEALVRLEGSLLTFHDTPYALEWRQSESMRRGETFNAGTTTSAEPGLTSTLADADDDLAEFVDFDG